MYPNSESLFTRSSQPDAASGVDTYLLSSSANTNNGTAVVMWVGEGNNANNRVARSLIKFALSSGEFHTCALTASGGLKCWGRNSQGQLGDGTTTQRLTPVDVSGLTSNVAAASTASDHSCALTTSGEIPVPGDYNKVIHYLFVTVL